MTKLDHVYAEWKTCPTCGGKDLKCGTCFGIGAVMVPVKRAEVAAPEEAQGWNKQ